MLAGADAWQFDTWRLAEVSGGLPLSVLGYFLIQRAGLVKTLRLSPRTLVKCLRVIEAVRVTHNRSTICSCVTARPHYWQMGSATYQHMSDYFYRRDTTTTPTTVPRTPRTCCRRCT